MGHIADLNSNAQLHINAQDSEKNVLSKCWFEIFSEVTNL